MRRAKPITISHKARRLVERAISLHAQRANTSVYAGILPTDSRSTEYRKQKAATTKDQSLTRKAQLSKRVLLEYLSTLEEENKRMKADLRAWDTVSP